MPDSVYPVVLSYVQAGELLAAKQSGQSLVNISQDLGISTVSVSLSSGEVTFPSGERLSWKDIEKIKKATSNCFELEGNELRAISYFSEHTNRMCSLFPTKRTPTMLIAGFT